MYKLIKKISLPTFPDLTEIFVHLKEEIGSGDQSDEFVSQRRFGEGLSGVGAYVPIQILA